ncbi:G2/mitotic-specific cyclin [Mycoemilia scoparia]|uniref:G2/mitotic-specific cyclin n=1 Tax=Mycoemilia scoparia TaxID=417184 RepID=A0A9W8A0Z2_9FUNG|nr:G2/mitotic-specific cyclin [Mycoemilia scoparia]
MARIQSSSASLANDENLAPITRSRAHNSAGPSGHALRHKVNTTNASAARVRTVLGDVGRTALNAKNIRTNAQAKPRSQATRKASFKVAHDPMPNKKPSTTVAAGRPRRAAAIAAGSAISASLGSSSSAIPTSAAVPHGIGRNLGSASSTSTLVSRQPSLKRTRADATSANGADKENANVDAAGPKRVRAVSAELTRRRTRKSRSGVASSKLESEPDFVIYNDTDGNQDVTKSDQPVYPRDSKDDEVDSQATVVEYPHSVSVPADSKYMSASEISKEAEKYATHVQSKSDVQALMNPPISAVNTERPWDDLDAEDTMDPMMVSEYITDIVSYLCDVEKKTMPAEDYIERQNELSWSMRGVLVNWLIQVHYQLRLLPETLFLAVNLIDRFLSLRYVSVPKLQLVGITALLLASKYEEMASPPIRDLAYLAGNGYTEEEILNAEVFMLRVLNFDLSYPGPMTFLRRVSKAENYNIQTRTVAKFLLEISLVDHRFMAFTPSLMAAAAINLARTMLSCGPWDANLQHYSGYTEDQLQECISLFIQYLAAPCEHAALQKKYAHRRFLKASIFCREWVARNHPDLIVKAMEKSQQLPSDPPVPVDS